MWKSVIAMLLAGCQPAFYHAVTPAPIARSDAHEVKVSQVAVRFVDDSDARNMSRVWLGLDLHNGGTTRWRLASSHVALVRQSDAIAPDGLMSEPSGDTQDAVEVEPGDTRRVWARFSNVKLDDPITGTGGARSERPVALALQTEGAAPLALSDPAHADPAWVDEESHAIFLADYGLGATGSGGDRAMGYDSKLVFAYRIGELDLGGAVATRIGVEQRPMQSGGSYDYVGLGVEMGYTLRYRQNLLRVAASWLGGASVHGDDKPVWMHELDGELQFGTRRRAVYPFRGRDSADVTFGYFRVGKIIAPGGYTVSLGVSWRLGS